MHVLVCLLSHTVAVTYWHVAAAADVVDTVSTSLLGMRPELVHSTAHAGSNTGTASAAMGGVVFGGGVLFVFGRRMVT